MSPCFVDSTQHKSFAAADRFLPNRFCSIASRQTESARIQILSRETGPMEGPKSLVTPSSFWSSWSFLVRAKRSGSRDNIGQCAATSRSVLSDPANMRARRRDPPTCRFSAHRAREITAIFVRWAAGYFCPRLSWQIEERLLGLVHSFASIQSNGRYQSVRAAPHFVKKRARCGDRPKTVENR